MKHHVKPPQWVIINLHSEIIELVLCDSGHLIIQDSSFCIALTFPAKGILPADLIQQPEQK